MYSRVTLLEIDTVRFAVDEATELFTKEVVPELERQEGYIGVAALVTPEGKGMIVTFWETEADAQDITGFASAQLARYVTMFKSPPGRECYEVAFADMGAVYAR